MVSALADAGAALDEPRLPRRRGRSARTSSSRACATTTGRLLRTYNRGQARLRAVLEDHAFLLEALLDALRGDVRPALVRRGARARRHDPRALRRPRERRLLLDRGRPRAADRAPQGHRRQPDPGRPVGRRLGLLRLAALTGEHRYEEAALGVIRLLHTIAPQHPAGFGHLLQAIDFHVSPVREVALVGPDLEPLERVVRSTLPPARRARRRRARRRAAARPGASPSTAAPPPTCASASPAGGRSPSRTSWPRCWTERSKRNLGSVQLATMARFLTFPAGKRSKFVVRGVFFVITAVVGGLFSGQVRGRAGERDRLLPPRQGRVGQVARGRQALPGRRARARGHRLRAQGRADRRRPPPGRRGPALVPVRPALDRAAAAEAGVLARTATPPCSRSRSARRGTPSASRRGWTRSATA